MHDCVRRPRARRRRDADAEPTVDPNLVTPGPWGFVVIAFSRSRSSRWCGT